MHSLFSRIIVTSLALCGLCFSSAGAWAKSGQWQFIDKTATALGEGKNIYRWGAVNRQGNIELRLMLMTSQSMAGGLWQGSIVTLDLPEWEAYAFHQEKQLGDKVHWKTQHLEIDSGDYQGKRRRGYSFEFYWDHIHTLQDTKKLILNYRVKGGDKSQSKTVAFPLVGFFSVIDKLRKSVESEPGGERFFLTLADKQTVPIKKLPLHDAKKALAKVKDIAKNMQMSAGEVSQYSIKQMFAKWEQYQADERQALKEKYRQIEALEPDYLSLNVCRTAKAVSHCRHVGRNAFAVDKSAAAGFHYGRIQGVIWRQVNSVVRVYPGRVAEQDKETGFYTANIEPTVRRADKSEYYYIVKNDRGVLDIRAVEWVDAK